MNYLFKFLKKKKKSKIVSFRKSKNRGIQKVDFFFEKSMLALKTLRIFLRSFLVLNDQDRNDSVFFKFGRRRAKRGPSEARSVRPYSKNLKLKIQNQYQKPVNKPTAFRRIRLNGSGCVDAFYKICKNLGTFIRTSQYWLICTFWTKQ